MSDESFDVIVVGGGHAGTEAAAVCARMGARTLLLTQDLTRIGVLSCNPSIGGIGKSHLVREVDALDGLMARAADFACIHNKTLNRSKGPAVRGVRVQADRSRYAAAVQSMLRATPGLTIRQGEAESLRVSQNGAVTGVGVGSGSIMCLAVVISTGTFLRGITHTGFEQTPAGRLGDAPSIPLTECLERLGLPLGRLKTGTPPRLARQTIDWDNLPPDWGDSTPAFLSFNTTALAAQQVECRITGTNSITHNIIRENLARSALYGGVISSVGPRYCPSIEDKIVKFANRERHQVFLEPEGLPGTADGHTIYPNGVSNSMPQEIQLAFLRTMQGLERVEMMAAGYAVEYDFVQPTALDHSLQVHALPGLFFAGQINGTTGYEEAAAQGIYAGINAAQWARSRPPMLLDRASSYIGVMVDDLVSGHLSEPYRMFTSRAEYRLQLRCDNADLRLTPLGIGVGCVSPARAVQFETFRSNVDDALARARKDSRSSAELSSLGIAVKQDGDPRTILDLVTSEHLHPNAALAFPWLLELSPAVRNQVITSGLYSGYLHRHALEAERMRVGREHSRSRQSALKAGWGERSCFT